MGGAQAGALASRLAAAALRGEGAAQDDGVTAETRVAELIQEANRRVHERASEDERASGMGTTMTVAIVESDRVVIGHVGDSRAYVIRNGTLGQLTEDHSLVAELVRSGKLSPEEAETHPQRSVITRALGQDPDVDVDTFSVPAREGDLFLLCSDGLTSMVADEDILQIVEKHRDDLDAAAGALVRAANRGGGEDNVTVVFFEIDGDGEGTLEETVAIGSGVDERTDDEEKTLDELEGLQPVEVASRDDGARGAVARPAPVRARRHPVAVSVAVSLLVVALLAVAGLFAVSRSHFVGADGEGRVVVYQGLPYDVVDSVRLYRAVYVSPLLAEQLTRPEREQLFDHNLESKDAAMASVRRLEQRVGLE
ncbi:MAG: protein phosphatase 2C domain-containing protein [Actinomycetota bacterium]|nr:protein phosphatase 2C domain-containing protein [Actinomycetota bacterium]